MPLGRTVTGMGTQEPSIALGEIVAAERRRRGLSVRAASRAGGISNTAWSEFEHTNHVTLRMQAAVAAAFGWPTDWPYSPPVPVASTNGPDMTMLSLIARLEHVVQDLHTEIHDLHTEVAVLKAQHP